MRIFIIPVTRTLWAFHCQPINAVPTRMTKWATSASERWSKWSVYPSTSWRGKIYTYGETLMDKISFKEYFLKEIPTKSEGALVSKVDIVVPNILSETEVVNDLRALIAKQEPYHARWIWYCCYMLPVSSLFTLVPVIPNFPFFYNLFRVYSHYKARHGAQHLQHLFERGAYEVIFDSELSKFYQSAYGSIESTVPSQGSSSDDASDASERQSLDNRTLESGLPLLEHDPPLITDEDITRMALYFQIPSFESAVRRARHQIIADISKSSQS
ncbi:hypothetical protein IWW48_000681 [Coemansia sp. RSA 1200]|nr:hypothetical protein IWW48_000681 [Coemansia sp. RSA 1200]